MLKQQGHASSNSVTSLCYNSDATTLVTGGTSGKIKLWQTRTGFCYCTFSQHNASINALQYIASSNCVVSASSDGTVRAFDLFRYRNFRTWFRVSCVCMFFFFNSNNTPMNIRYDDNTSTLSSHLDCGRFWW